MRKIIGILLLSASFSVPGFAAEKLVPVPMTNGEVAQQMISCSAVMQMSADRVKDDPDLLNDVHASAERYRLAASYYLRGQMDVDDINAYVTGGTAAARATLEGEYKEKGGNAIEKHLGECNTPEMLTKGFEAYQALGQAEAAMKEAEAAALAAMPKPVAAPTAMSAPGPEPVSVMPLDPMGAQVKTTVNTVPVPMSGPNARIPISVKNAPTGAK